METRRHATAVVRPSRPEDFEGVVALLRAADLPSAGVREHFSEFLVATGSGGLVGAAGIERYGTFGLLRSVVVAEDARGRGLGQLLTSRALERAGERRLLAVYLLTTTSAAFFERFGFRRVTRAGVPTELYASAELQGACPDSAIMMALDLAPRA